MEKKKRIIAIYCSNSVLRITFFCNKNSYGSLPPFLKVVQKVKQYLSVETAHLIIVYCNGTKNEIFKRIICQVNLNTPCKYLELFSCKYREEEI